MQFSQEQDASECFRSLNTNDMGELARFQHYKNRHYTQLQPGRLNGSYREINLGSVQLFRERLSAGSRIEAAPSTLYLPFALVLPHSGEYDFCRQPRKENHLVQATGGHWDILFRDSLDYFCTAFSRQHVSKQYQLLTGRELPPQWLSSAVVPCDHNAIQYYQRQVTSLMQLFSEKPNRILSEPIIKSAEAELLSATFGCLNSHVDHFPREKLHGSRRRRGVDRVIDYLKSHAHELPTIPELCSVADMSQRSLEYGFKEYLSITPIQYLKLVRLNRARADLLKANPGSEQVSAIAMRWGFLEFGRFARDYRQLFTELPSATLQSAATTDTDREALGAMS